MLADLIPERAITVGDISLGRREFDFKEILSRRLYERNGLFQYMLADSDAPRIISVVRDPKGLIESYALLIAQDEMVFFDKLRRLEESPRRFPRLGLLGAYTIDDARRSGRGKLAMDAMMGFLRDTVGPTGYHVGCQDRIQSWIEGTAYRLGMDIDVIPCDAIRYSHRNVDKTLLAP